MTVCFMACFPEIMWQKIKIVCKVGVVLSVCEFSCFHFLKWLIYFPSSTRNVYLMKLELFFLKSV